MKSIKQASKLAIEPGEERVITTDVDGRSIHIYCSTDQAAALVLEEAPQYGLLQAKGDGRFTLHVTTDGVPVEDVAECIEFLAPFVHLIGIDFEVD